MEKIDWGEMLAISSQELKKHKNATRIHEIITELSGLDSWVMEATRKQAELKEDNERLDAKRTELAMTVASIKATRNDIASRVESLSVEVKELQDKINNDCAEHKKVIEADLDEFRTDINQQKEVLEEEYQEKSNAYDADLKAKKAKIESAKSVLISLRDDVEIAAK